MDMVTRLAVPGILAWFLLAATMAKALVIAKPGCPSRCGNVTIPYPFGTREGCYLNENFYINCSDHASANSSKPTLGHTGFVVNNISMDGQLQILATISRDCYNALGSRSEWISSWFSQPIFNISNTRNKFTAIGCDTYAYLDGFVDNKRYSAGCMSLCDRIEDVVNGSCSGFGCCQIQIPGGLKDIYVGAFSFKNHTNVSDFNLCSYAFLVEEDKFVFSSDYVRSIPEDYMFPMSLDWVVGNETCEEAKKNTLNYSCHNRSECYEPGTSLGYLCKCLDGYEGNPYLPGGCLDINECKNISSHCNKNADCNNLPGSFECICRSGYEGDGRLNGTGCSSIRKLQGLPFVNIALGSSISILVLVLSLSWIYWGLWQRNLVKQREKFFRMNGGILLQQELSKHKRPTAAKIFTAEELKKATNNFHESRILGQGGYGAVYKGILQDNRVVAIKKSMIADHSQVEQFINEVIVLSQVNHRNVVKLLGCCLETEVPLLVYEFISNGTLYYHLHNSSNASFIPWATRLRIAAETAGALSHLHSAAYPPIIHRDVKSTNILLDEHYTAKVSDFGASRLVPLDQTQLTTLVQGTLGYLDPEYFQSSQLTEKSDVYSFGVVLVELQTGRKALCFQMPEEERNLAMHFVSALKMDRLFKIIDPHVLLEENTEQLMEVACLRRDEASSKETECLLGELSDAKAEEKSYIVYFGEHSHGQDLTSVDLDSVTNSHYELLGSFVGSSDIAKEKIFYSYTQNINKVMGLPQIRECWSYLFCLSMDKGKGNQDNDTYTTGCMSVCDKPEVVSDTCSGVGCCQVPIPKGLENVRLTLSSFFKHENITSFSNCSYGFVVENDFTFSPKYLQGFQGETKLPMVVDWAVGDESCESAAQNQSSFLCKGKYSTCYTDYIGRGYRCNCSDGYQGNPYLLDACYGISISSVAVIVGTRGVTDTALLASYSNSIRRKLEFDSGGLDLQIGSVKSSGRLGNTIHSGLGSVWLSDLSDWRRFRIRLGLDSGLWRPDFGKPPPEPGSVRRGETICTSTASSDDSKPSDAAARFPDGGGGGGASIIELTDRARVARYEYRVELDPHNRYSIEFEPNIELRIFCRARARVVRYSTRLGSFTPLVGTAWLYLLHKKRKLIKLKEKFFKQNGGLMLQQLTQRETSPETAKIFNAEELRKATNNYDESMIVGRGGYGIVYKGLLEGNNTVAIKKSKIIDQGQIEQFINEVVVLSKINHRNVVKLLGCCLDEDVPLLVYEFVGNGTLFDHIHDKGRAATIPWNTWLRIAAETAGVLSYLHSAASMPIIHRDVKTTNILLDDTYTAKVSDFGASRLVPIDQTQLSTMVQGTLGYLDPEYLHTSQLTEKSDVYSFGVVLVELLTGRKALAFDGPQEERSLAMYFISSLRKNCLFDILESHLVDEENRDQIMEVAKLAKKCLEVKGEERPSMKEAAMELEGLRLMEKHPWVNVELMNSEETEYLLNGKPSDSYSYGGTSNNSSSVYHSLRSHVITLPLDNGR
ncbi:hypothetical protein CCACVL1_01592 [Corchorus capsularis]|uniref:Protein kinase domain-containing protein n=1 Tax=Corchorus capsularis TaxID=210143 RepID=A0A1R3KH33_COCAP|nr:hypothetical protein CCACVL1_01592 [Corchorus capsularis]